MFAVGDPLQRSDHRGLTADRIGSLSGFPDRRLLGSGHRETQARLHAIGTNRARVATADADLERAVATAIHRGATWAEIADGLGVTRQSRSRALPAAPLRPGHRRRGTSPLAL